jgi:GNAT superfamily N-acetyltransferase
LITFCAEPLTPTLPELQALFPLHWKELALDQDYVPLDPQYDIYLRRDAAGEVLFIAGRDAGRLVAYFVGFVAPGLHYRTCLTLTMDIFLVLPEYRKGSAGVRLFRTVEAEARRRGVNRMFMGSKLHKDSSALFKRLGYEPVEIYHAKYLG